MDKVRQQIWRKRQSTDSEGSDSSSPEPLDIDPQEVNMANVEQLTELIGRMAQYMEQMGNTLAQQNQVNQQLAQHLQQAPPQQAAQAAPQPVPNAAGAQQQPEPRLQAGTFPELILDGFDEAKKLEAFSSWEASVRNTAIAIGVEGRVEFNRVAAAILASFRGEAAYQAQGVAAGNYANMDALMNGLSALFCGAATRERCYNLFTEAKQGAKEDITAWWSRLQNLYHRSFQAPRPNDLLIRNFIEGLADRKVQERLLTREANVPQDYDQLKEVTLQIAGKEETWRIINKARGHGHRIQVDRPQAGGVTPMEVDAVRKGAGKGKGQGGQVNNVNRKPRVGRNQCLDCGVEGHWKDKCPNPRKNWWKKREGGQVNAVNLEQEDQVQYVDGTNEDDEDDWAGVAAAAEAGNGQAQA